MSSATGISNLYTNSAYNTTDTASASSLDKNGFLKMLSEQMKNQDPTSGQDPNQYFQTISQMTTVEQLTNLAAASTASLSRQRDTSATSLIGKTVTYPGSDGLPVTGLVESVQLSATDGPSLTVAGVAGIDPDLVNNVK
ncbi:MAG TPA: flagellar hook capping FlgD N-terminal domain-containing protein [Baekduia sp.]|nr:flagellar hook capping FlgD N-terminal domain-containing protein [Baekduia sp.]